MYWTILSWNNYGESRDASEVHPILEINSVQSNIHTTRIFSTDFCQSSVAHVKDIFAHLRCSYRQTCLALFLPNEGTCMYLSQFSAHNHWVYESCLVFNALASLFGVTHLKLYRFVEWTGTIKPPWHWMKRNFNRIDNEIPQNEDKQKLSFQNSKYTCLKLLWSSVQYL